MRTLANMFRALSIIAIGGLIGYYDYQTSGIMGVITDAVYFVLGILLVTTWKSPERNQSDQNLDVPSLTGQDTAVNAVMSPEETVKEVEDMPRFNLEEAMSDESH